MPVKRSTAINSAEGAARAFGAYLRAQRNAARLTLRELADRAQISNPYLSQIERGLHEPSVKVIRSLAEALDLSAEVLLAEAAGLRLVAGNGTEADEGAAHPGTGPDVQAAIEGDARLSPSQKEALLAVYRSMVEGD